MNALFTTNKILFDYFSFTIKNVEPEDVISMLGLEGIQFTDNFGARGYSHRYYYDGVSIMFGSRDHVWCEMSGQGCRVFETYGTSDWFGLAYQVLNNDNAHMTRIDIAYDDFNGLLDLDSIKDDVKNNCWISRANSISVIEDFSRYGLSGSTVNIGQRGSNVSCRIYDKAKERNRDDIDHWVRCELQIRHKHADNFIKYLLSDNFNYIFGVDINVENRLDALYFAVLNHFIRFIDISCNDDSNRWRKPCAVHWQKFIDSYFGNSISLYSDPGVDYNEMRLRHSVEEQYGGMIYTYIQLIGLDELETAVLPKKFKLNKKYQYLLDSKKAVS